MLTSFAHYIVNAQKASSLHHSRSDVCHSIAYLWRFGLCPIHGMCIYIEIKDDDGVQTFR